jgi:3-deoxy-7-phosphoheptulonate synthase
MTSTANLPEPTADDGERAGFDIAGHAVGEGFTLIAGPCTVESREQTLTVADVVAAEGAAMLRGGAYKPRSSPYSFQGLGREGLAILAEAKRRTGLPIVTELVDVRDLDDVLGVADVIQVGARSMQNYPLLTELGRTDRAVLLKRGLSATLDELVMAAEYVLKEGNERVMLCERGIRTHETAYRFTLDQLAVPALQERTRVPVLVDPSHAPGRRDRVEPMSLAAAAAGADGIIVEVHSDPENAICDGPQALHADDFGAYAERVRTIAAAAGSGVGLAV